MLNKCLVDAHGCGRKLILGAGIGDDAGTRRGSPCRAPIVAGKTRCRVHGGVEQSGTPAGNQNALKHGRFTREARTERKALLALIREASETLTRIEKS